MIDYFAVDKIVGEKSRDEIIKAPFPYPGGKLRSVEHILPLLPYRKTYAEVFGGSGVVLLNRRPSKLDVFNDRASGVTDFYRVVKHPVLMEQLLEKLDLTVHSREEFVWCKENWDKLEWHDQVTRAYMWYYMVTYSFGSLARNFGRATGGRGNLAGKIREKLPLFWPVHERLKHVQIENQDFRRIMEDYDSAETVFYLDPDYVDTDQSVYKNRMTVDDHRDMLDMIFSMHGFVAVSGYANPLYDNQKWDERHTWESFVSIKSAAYNDGNHKAHLDGLETRGKAEEVLWIKR